MRRAAGVFCPPCGPHALCRPIFSTFQEIVNVNASRLLLGPFTTFLQQVRRDLPTLGSKWDSSVAYEVLLASIGGEATPRHARLGQFREAQVRCCTTPPRGARR